MPDHKSRPILFSAHMVRALLSGEKTQTRRIINNPDDGVSTITDDEGAWECLDGWEWKPRPCPFGQPGSLLWVRETWATLAYRPTPGSIVYRADTQDGERVRVDAPWRPSIHMPRWASRIVLEIAEIRVQRLQEIGEQDARAEGIAELDGYFDAYDLCVTAKHIGCPAEDARATFALLWDSINAKRGAGWAVNPWVWAITFKRVEE